MILWPCDEAPPYTVPMESACCVGRRFFLPDDQGDLDWSEPCEAEVFETFPIPYCLHDETHLEDLPLCRPHLDYLVDVLDHGFWVREEAKRGTWN